ncbi:unnamed protein product, partial [Ixodes persulcatus]
QASIKIFVVLFLAVVALVHAQDDGPPMPFEFSYNVADEEGNTHQHQSSSDASGKRTGSYGYTNKDGLFRLVEYEADENGYRAVIKTNEPGTATGESADAKFESSAPAPY